MADSQQAGRPIVYVGAKEICSVVGIDYRQIALYVRNFGLPAFKISGQRKWLAVPEDLELWMHEQRNKYLKKGEESRVD